MAFWEIRLLAFLPESPMRRLSRLSVQCEAGSYKRSLTDKQIVSSSVKKTRKKRVNVSM